MTQAHVPNLALIETLSDEEVKFYAIVGAVVSLSAAIELVLIDIFTKGLGINSEAVGQVFYQVKTASLQRDMAIAAMNGRLKGMALLPEWTSLADRLVKLTGQRGLRNLIAHNIVLRFEISGAIGGAPIGALPIGGGSEESYIVFQDHQKVVAGIKKPQQATFYHLLEFCRELIALLTSLESFLARVP